MWSATPEGASPGKGRRKRPQALAATSRARAACGIEGESPEGEARGDGPDRPTPGASRGHALGIGTGKLRGSGRASGPERFDERGLLKLEKSPEGFVNGGAEG